MGTFDRIRANGRVFQTKAFGKNMMTYHVGDVVRIVPVVFNSSDNVVDGADRMVQVTVIPKDCPPEDCPQYAFCVVEDGVITRVVQTPLPGVPVISQLGTTGFE